MTKKKAPKGTWSDRRKWLMGSLTAIVVASLSKVWDALAPGRVGQSPPPVAERSAPSGITGTLRVTLDDVTLSATGTVASTSTNIGDALKVIPSQ